MSVHAMEKAVSVGCDQALFEVKEQACAQQRLFENSRALGRGLVRRLPRVNNDRFRMLLVGRRRDPCA